METREGGGGFILTFICHQCHICQQSWIVSDLFISTRLRSHLNERRASALLGTSVAVGDTGEASHSTR